MKDLKAKKSLGQNFLKDENILNKIASSIETNNDLIIEIGPGMGALTKKLKQKNSSLIAYEIDERTKEYLLPLEDDKTKIIYKDFLKTDISKDISEFDYNNIYIIANIPYYITTPIIEHIIDQNIDVSQMTLLVQKEVGERFSAKPNSKDYGYMTVYLNYFFEVSKVCDVKKECFSPVPKVDSIVVKFDKKNKLYDIDVKSFSEFLKECFRQKRKKLKNNLKNYDIDKINGFFNENQLDENCRAEQLSLELFVNLYNMIK